MDVGVNHRDRDWPVHLLHCPCGDVRTQVLTNMKPESSVTLSDFGTCLDGMLRSRNLNRQDFGKRIGVDPSMVSR